VAAPTAAGGVPLASPSRSLLASPTPSGSAPPATAAVTVDASGRSQASGATSLSWSQPVHGGSRLLVAEVSVGVFVDFGCSLSASDNGTAMRRLSTVHDDSSPTGFHGVFYRVAPPTGTNTITAQLTGCTADELTGGSVSFNGVSQSAPLGSAVTATGDSTTASATVRGTHSGDLVVGFVSCGSAIQATRAPSTRRFLQNGDDFTGAGNSAGATQLSSGGSNRLAWSVVSDVWGVTAVEVRS
ncbi:MAG: hypothetical protein J2P15_00705, partial [Micromonosporaceae bacterium]|nr:hypothetical protein [Micromonosporaceae bacterium]